MKISIQDLTTPRQWRAAVGCDAHQFDDLFKIFAQAYATLNGLPLADRTVISPSGTHMQDEADLLFFTLFSCKSGLTYDVLGLVCGRDGATAKRRQDEGLAILREALRQADCLPEREFQSPAELQRYFSKRRAILLDATEFVTQRPQEKGAQKAQYSGKKNAIRSKHLSPQPPNEK
ncbi:MAG: hypothetical protein ACRYFX_08770 [Janthinobacterium lividum]